MGDYELVRYSKSKIKKAGEYIAKHDSRSEDFEYNIGIVDNWRASHAYPLNCITAIVRGALVEKENYYIVQRLKRCESIVRKLRRRNRTSLDRMQDLGGCRVIVPSFKDLYDTIKLIKDAILANGHIIEDEDDYLNDPPKHSGYRCYHLIVKYQANDPYNNMYVEIQVRTRLQHSWATAVEIIDTVENETLKAGTGNEDFRYFFKLASALFSIEEGTTIVEGVPKDKFEIINELYRIENHYHIREKLSAYSNAIQIISKYPDSAGYYLLVTDMTRKTLSVLPFKFDEISLATKAYSTEEKNINNGIDVVLVEGKSFDVIRESYSNYFLESQHFLTKISEFCASYPESPSVLLDTSNNAFKLIDKFKAEQYSGNIPEKLTIREDGIGEPQGDTIYCPGWAITLPNSYLRYSAIICNFDSEICSGKIKPYKINGPAIIATSSGACFYVEEQKWCCVSELPCIVIRHREESDKKYLLLVIAWLKSNICTWDMLWNHKSHCIYNKATFSSIFVPDLSEDEFTDVSKLVKEILEKDKMFVNYYQKLIIQEDEGQIEEKITDFNNSVLIPLKHIERIFSDFYKVSPEDLLTINSELKLKGYFTYS